jgi:hypothetical protein
MWLYIKICSGLPAIFEFFNCYYIIMPIFHKTAGILKLISYWLKFQKAASAIIKQFPTAARTQTINFLKAAGVDNISQISSKFCSSFQKPVIVVTSGFRKFS